MQLIKCLFCGQKTTLHRINASKKMKGKVITLSNAPVYYCQKCNETFIAKETQDVFRYIQERGLNETRMLFNFDEMSKNL